MQPMATSKEDLNVDAVLVFYMLRFDVIMVDPNDLKRAVKVVFCHGNVNTERDNLL